MSEGVRSIQWRHHGAQRQSEQSLVEGAGLVAESCAATESTAGLWGISGPPVKPDRPVIAWADSIRG
jgi:hypothetical protein